MTFTANEISLEGGSPIELYDLVLGTESYHLTTSEESVVVGPITYTPTVIRRQAIRIGPEERAAVLEIEMPSDHPFVQRYITIVPGSEAILTIRRLHRLDGVTPEVLVWFKGIARSVGFSDDGFRASVAVLPITGTLERSIPRFLYSNLCNHVLYDSGCKVEQNSFRHIGTISTTIGSTVVVPGSNGFVNGFFNGGFLSLDGGKDFRLVLEHTGDNLRMLLPFPGNVVGAPVQVFAGCEHTLPVCKNKFDNVQNYGGFAFVPTRNLFETGLT